MESRVIMYGFWASSCSWRVRAALHLKQIPFEERPVDILKEKHQITDQFRAINPAQKVPALIIDGMTLIESMAIIQYLEDIKPDPPLMPKTPQLRARTREISETIVSGIQPLQNPYLNSHFDTDERCVQFTRYWTDRGLQTLEVLLGKSAGKYCVEDTLTVADACLVPQVFNAGFRHKIDVGKYPIVNKVYETLLKEKVFEETHPFKVKSKNYSHHGVTLVESMAIIQYLEDVKPDPPLTPKTPLLRARSREICEIIVSGIQPLQNVGLKSHFEEEKQYSNFTTYFTDRGLQTLEELLGKSAGKCCVGDTLTVADLCFVPQMYNAVTRHKLDISKYPIVNKLYDTLLKEKVFQETHPLKIKSRN